LAIRGRFLSARAAWTGTPTGVFKLQVSFDSGVTWSDAPGMSANFTANSQAQPAGSASSAIWSFVDIPGGSWRIRYTGTSVGGAATLRFAWAP
jgi:hypothetical protein